MGSLSTGRLARRRWSAAGPLSTAVSFSAVPMVRIRFPPAASQQQTVPALGFDGATDCPKEPFAGAGPMVRIPFPPAERCYGAGGEEMAPSIAARKQLMECPMPQPNDLSRSLVALDQN